MSLKTVHTSQIEQTLIEAGIVHYNHSETKAKEFSELALKRIKSEKLLPNPQVYELWYVFYSKENPEVVHAIEMLEKTGETITNDECHSLYDRFLSDNTQQQRVREAGDKIQSTIKEMNGFVSNVQDATSRYNATLTDVRTSLNNDISKQQMEVVLKKVMSNTEDMMEQNKALEEKLSKSSKIMMALQRDLEMVRKEALTDSLTNLANRKAFDAEIRRVAEEATEQGTTFCLALLDIDHFKSFNDNYGHQVGDQVLRLVARTLVEGVKGRDIASRFGGEEFAIILPETNLPAGVKVSDYLRKAVAGKEVVNRNTGETLGRITLSGGVAQYMPGEKIEDLIERTDAALYTAKHNGRNQIAAAPAPGQKKSAR